MYKNYLTQLLFTLVFTGSLFNAQVDVVYNDLVWSDDFTANGAVDATKWHHQTQLPIGGSWYNGEVQHYTNQVTNSFADGGFLKIVAKKENYTDQGVTKNYTSARLNSKFAFKYGRIDVRAKLPVNSGTWPAIWMLGKNINEPGGFFSSTYGTTNWPACGEIDIMEHGIFPSQSINYVQSTVHTPSGYGGGANGGGINASDLANNYHVYSLNWSPNQLTFLLDGVAFFTYNPAVKNASTWPFDNEQYILLNLAMGGIAGNIASNFTQAEMVVDYVKVYQNTSPDSIAPSNFTATVGTVTAGSFELLLNAVDNSGTVFYDISGASTQTVSHYSGVQKSVTVTGLSPATTYNFNITAKDASGNIAANSPLTVSATTLGAGTNTSCSGISNLASQGSFTTGYSYQFETIGTDVKFTFELLDTDKVGVVAYLWKQSPFTEYPMTNVSGNKFTKTITGQTLGSTITYAVKFAFAGGLSVTKYYDYVVGTSCNSLAVENLAKEEQLVYPNPVTDVLHLKLADNRSQIILMDGSGKSIKELQLTEKQDIDMSDCPSGIYFLTVKNSKGTENFKIIKK